LPAGHLSNLQRPRSFTVALLEFLLPKIDTPEHLLQVGQDTRRAVLGDLHADRATASTTDFNREFQGLITRYAWGTVWARPAFDPKTRRILALSMIAALGHWPEFRMHVRAGLMHELEPCDLKEVLLQVAIYAGLPAANTGFQIAAEEMAEQKPA